MRPVGLLDLLDLEEEQLDTFLAITPAEGPPRLFGGQVAAQALRAATLTVDDDRFVHSLHSYFVRPGRPGVSLRLVVERIRDGRSFSTRRVTAVQGDEAIFVLETSFHIPEEGFDWQLPAPGDIPPPEAVPARDLFGRRPPWAKPNSSDPAGSTGPAPSPQSAPESDTARSGTEVVTRRGPRAAMLFEIRPIRPGEDFSIHPAWVRLGEPIGDDPALHASALTYVSDMAVVRSAVAPGAPVSWGGASLDHSIWFHRPFRVDDWLLFSADPVSNFGARGLARGSFHNAEGTLVASFAQECLLRSTGMPPPP